MVTSISLTSFEVAISGAKRKTWLSLTTSVSEILAKFKMEITCSRFLFGEFMTFKKITIDDDYRIDLVAAKTLIIVGLDCTSRSGAFIFD